MNLTNILLINCADWFGTKVVERILGQKVNVIVVDDFIEENMRFIRKFSDNNRFTFIEKDKFDSLFKDYETIKYILHFNHEYQLSDKQVSSKTFIRETAFIDKVLSLALEKQSNYVLTSSIHLHKELVLKKNVTDESSNRAYHESQLQDFMERSVLEYAEKTELNARVIRLGNIYSPDMQFNKNNFLFRIIDDALYKDSVRIFGDGLEYYYYIYDSDAVSGVFKILFNLQTKGKIFNLANFEEVSILSIVNKAIALENRKLKIKFLKPKHSFDPLYEKSYTLDNNLDEIDWEPKVNFDRGFANLYEAYRKEEFRRGNLKESKNSSINTQNVNEIEYNTTSRPLNDEFDLSDKFIKKNNKSAISEKQNKKSGIKVNGEVNFRNKKYVEEEKKSFTPRKIIGIVLIEIFLLLFVFIPFIRGIIFALDFHSNVNDLNSVILSEPDSYKADSDLYNDAINTTGGGKWVLWLTGRSSLAENIQSICLGIDNSDKAVEIYFNNNFDEVISSEEKISQEMISIANDLIILLNTANDQLSKVDVINLPGNVEESVVRLKQWVQQKSQQISEKLSTTDTE